MNQVELSRVVISTWDVGNASVEHIQTGVDGNQTFHVTDGASRGILRVYGEQGRNHPDWVRFELELLVHLADAGVSVAAPIVTRDGSLLKIIDDRPAALFEFAGGDVEWPTEPSLAGLLGASFAEMHCAANTYITSAGNRSLDTDSLLLTPLAMMRKYLEDSNADDNSAWATLADTASQCANLLEAIPDAQGTVGPIHGDLHQGNCHFDVHKLTIFDFSNAAVGWRVYDLSGFLWPFRDDTILDPAIRAACDAFLEGYNNVRPLQQAERMAIAASVKARDFWETGNWLQFGDNLDAQDVRFSLRRLADRFRKHPISATV